MIVRLGKALLVFLMGVFMLLIGADNIVDYSTNFEFVRHVLAMDTLFPDSSLTWRAITDPSLQHAAYALIIAAELLGGILCVAGAQSLHGAATQPAVKFNRAKGFAVAGLVIVFALYFFGFLTVGGEWFQMWQSAHWNGQAQAFRIAAIAALLLVFLCQTDGELP